MIIIIAIIVSKGGTAACPLDTMRFAVLQGVHYLVDFEKPIDHFILVLNDKRDEQAVEDQYWCQTHAIECAQRLVFDLFKIVFRDTQCFEMNGWRRSCHCYTLNRTSPATVDGCHI